MSVIGVVERGCEPTYQPAFLLRCRSESTPHDRYSPHYPPQSHPSPWSVIASSDPARLVAFHPSSKATSKQWLHPLSRPSNTRPYPPVGRPCQYLTPKSTIATVRLEANSP